jgi:glycosyltransferase involved in cell wall biosynthesis
MRKNIILKCPILTRSGYGEQSRFALRSLRSRPDLFNVFVQPLQWGATSWVNDISAEREWIDDAIEKTIGFIQQGGKFDVSLQITVPNEFENMAPLNIGYTAGIETTKVAPQWLEHSNNMKKLIVVSTHSKNVFESTVYRATNEQTGEEIDYGLQVPVDVINYPAKHYDDLPELELNLDYDFNFLLISQYGPRKNIANTIKWFISEFKDEEVGFVIKTNMAKNSLIDRINTEAKFKKILADVQDSDDRKCKIYLLHGDMTDEEIHSLYTHSQIKAFVSLPHGEGFGLPLFEAAYSGIPVVTVGWSGQLDFLVDDEGKEKFYNVAFDINNVQKEAVWDGVIQADSKWAYAREGSAKKQMRQCYEDVINNNIERAAAHADFLNEKFNEEKLYAQFVDSIKSVIGETATEEAKVIVL